METTDGTSVADGPKSAATIPDAGSVVLRQEHDFEVFENV